MRLWKGGTEVNLDAKIPTGPLAGKWDKHKFDLKLVNPSNKRKYDIIVVGSGLAGASAAVAAPKEKVKPPAKRARRNKPE